MHPNRLAQVIVGCVLLWSLACAGNRAAPPAPAPVAPPPPSAAAPASQAAPPAEAAPASVPVANRLDAVTLGNTQGLAGALQIAIGRGYFQEQGIELRQEEFNSTTDIVPPLTTGQLDAGSTTPNASLFNALARGIRMTMALAGTEVAADSTGFPLVSRLGPDGPIIRDVADLRGKRMGQALRGVINEWALDKVLQSAGMRVDDVEVVVMPFPDQVTALGSGHLDGAVFPEPFGTIAVQKNAAAYVMNADSYIAGGQVALMSFSDRFAHERPEVARRWAVAYLKGARDYMDAMEKGRDREAVVALMAQAAHIDPRIVEKAGYFPVRRDGRVNAEGLQAMLDWLADRGYVPQKPDLAPLIDNQFADYAAGVLSSTQQ